MSNSTHFDEIAAILRRVEAAAYERGKADAKREILAHLTAMDDGKAATAASDSDTSQREVASEPSQPRPETAAVHPASERQRAPKGIVPRFVSHVLTNDPGRTPRSIQDRAETDMEKMIKLASIRSELRQGRDSGRYRDVDGRWYLVRDGEEDEAEGQTVEAEPSASNSEQEGGDYGAPLTRPDAF